MLEKAATVKKFEYLPLGSELNKQTITAEKQYKRLDKAYKIYKIEHKAIKKRKTSS